LAVFRPSKVDGIQKLISSHITKYVDFWYLAVDAVLACSLLLSLLCFASLPLLSVQSQILFNREFAKVIALKLRRAKIRQRILA